MPEVRWGAFSGKGIKTINQDCHAVTVPDFSRLQRRGVIAAVADGISSSQVSQYASELAINEFVRDYLMTADVWSPARAAELVLRTINTRLYIKSQLSPYRENPDKGYVCTFSAVLLYGDKAILLHCGDSRIYHVRQHQAELCTEDHRQQGEGGHHYLSNALGIKPELNVDISARDILPGDIFVVMTDGIAETLSVEDWLAVLQQADTDLTKGCEQVANMALDFGCTDNLTIAAVNVTAINKPVPVTYGSAGYLPFIQSPITASSVIDEWCVEKQLSTTDRSSVYLARHNHTNEQVVLKVPAVSMQDNSGFLDEMIKEEWVAKRVAHPQLLAGVSETFSRSCFYIVLAYSAGVSLRQWRDDNGAPDLMLLRDWATQLSGALTALHRQGILHQDIRPENVLVGDNNTLTLIDYGAASFCGHNFLMASEQLFIPGDLLFAAPEYFVGLWPDERAEQFSLAVLLYYLLSGEYPYDASVAKKTSYSGLLKLRYISLNQRNVSVPAWLDATIKRACHPQANKRYESLSEFVYDLHHPNPAYGRTLPLMERHPVRAWQGISGILAIMVIVLLVLLFDIT